MTDRPRRQQRRTNQQMPTQHNEPNQIPNAQEGLDVQQLQADDLHLNNSNIREIVDKYINGEYIYLEQGVNGRTPMRLPPIGSWNVSRITNMSSLFSGKAFDEDINGWDVSNVTNMSSMFKNSEFNQPLNNWNVSNVRTMRQMFAGAESFQQDLSGWNLHPDCNIMNIFSNSRMFNHRNLWPQHPRERAQNQAQGEQNVAQQVANIGRRPEAVAFEVHRAFDEINYNELLRLINNGIEVKVDEDYLKNNIIDNLKLFLLAYEGTDPTKEELTNKFNSLMPKFEVMNFSNPNKYLTALNFVKRQSKQYQDNYIKMFLNECFNAYNNYGQDNTSCVKGIQERIIIALGQAGYDIDKPLYKQISEVIFPIKDSQLYTFLSQCIKEKETELTEMANINEKKTLMIMCVTAKIQETNPNVDINSLSSRINNAVDLSIDMLGGKRKKRSIKKRKSIKQITKKRRNLK